MKDWTRTFGLWVFALTLAMPLAVAQQKNKEAGPPIGDDKAVTPATSSSGTESTDGLPYADLSADKVEAPELPAPEMKRYQAVANAGTGWPQPSTVAEVPVNAHADTKSPLKEKKVEFSTFNPDKHDLKLAIVWKENRERMAVADLAEVSQELDKVWIGIPSDKLKLNGKGELLYKDKPIWIVLGWIDGAASKFYDEGILERNNELLARFAADILLPAKSESLETYAGNPVYFAVFLDGQNVADLAQEKALQEKIYWLLAGKSVKELETDTWGNLYWKEKDATSRKKVELRFFNLTDRRLNLIKEEGQLELDNKFRRQTRYALTVEVNKAAERLTQLQGANQKIARVQQILNLKRSITREERQKELTEAERLVEEATTAWKTYGDGYPQLAAQTRKLATYKTDVAYQLGRLSYPFALELPKTCDSFVLYQLNADTVNLYLKAAKVPQGLKKPAALEKPAEAEKVPEIFPDVVPEEKEPGDKTPPLPAKAEEKADKLEVGNTQSGPRPLSSPKSEPAETVTEEKKSTEPDRVPDLAKDDLMLAQFKGERIPFHCFDGAIAVYAKWAPTAESNLVLNLQKSNLTAEDLKTFEEQGLFAINLNQLVVAHKLGAEESFQQLSGEVKRGSKTLARLDVKEWEDSFYEFSSDGSVLRRRLTTPSGWDNYLFEKLADGFVRAFYVDADGKETEIGKIAAKDLSTVNSVEGSLAFSTDRFEPATALEQPLDGTGSSVTKDKLESLKGSNALFLVRGGKLLFARRAQEGQKIKDVKIGDLDDKTVFVARYEGDATFSHILTPKADFFQSHFNFGASCSNYSAVIEDEKEVQLFWSGRKSEALLGVQGLGNVSCSGEGIAFFAKKISYDSKVLGEKLSNSSNVSTESIKTGRPENTLVVLHNDELKILLAPFPGHKFKSLKSTENAKKEEVFLVGYEGDSEFASEISTKGEWLYPVRYGNAKLGYSLLDFTNEKKTLLFLHGRVLAGVEHLISAKAYNKSLAVIADGIYSVKGLDGRLRNRVEGELKGKNTLFVLNENEVLTKMNSRSSREDEVYENVGMAEIKGVEPRFRVWTANNSDYTELVGLDGRNHRFWKYGECPHKEVELDISDAEKVWADELSRQKTDEQNRLRELFKDGDPFKKEPLPVAEKK
ncbi:MAG: hypothetical protein H6617_10945 [Bdellovibrionaceae bacterium]|nr:hypothetical protein [Pseudobdellovibrionaceae bacterium]